MRRSTQFAWIKLRRCLAAGVIASILSGASSVTRLYAQESGQTPAPTISKPTKSSASPLGPDLLIQDQAKNQATARAFFAPLAVNSDPWSRDLLAPFALQLKFSNSSSLAGNGISSIGQSRFGLGQQDSSSFNPSHRFAMRSRQGGVEPLFSSTGILGANPVGSLGATPFALPSFDQLLRGSLYSAFSSPPSSFRVNYQDLLKPGGSFPEFARPNTALIFTTTDLGNGVFFSAGTDYGHSSAGTPAAGLGSNTSSESKHSGPALALKLSF